MGREPVTQKRTAPTEALTWHFRIKNAPRFCGFKILRALDPAAALAARAAILPTGILPPGEAETDLYWSDRPG